MTPNSSNACSPEPHPVRGYCFIAAATFCWAASASFGKLVFSGRIGWGGRHLGALDPLILSQARVTFSLLALVPALLLLRGRSALAMRRADILRCMALGVLGITVSNFFYYLAIDKTNVPTAIILQYTAPIWVLLYMLARGRQRATWPRIVAVGAAVAGSALAIGVIGGGSHMVLNAAGVLAAEIAALGFAFYNVYGHDVLRRNERWRVIVYALLGAVIFWQFVNPPWKVAHAHYSGDQWLFLVVFALGSWLLPFSFYFAGLQHIDATRAIVTSCLEPVFAIAIAAGLLGDQLGPWQIVGVVAVLVGTVIIQLPSRGEPAEEPPDAITLRVD